MIQTKTPISTPSPKKRDFLAKSAVGQTGSPSAVFISLALDMSWRLAIVVLVPIIGGFELDKKLKTTPLITIVGFVIAMIGMALVLWRMLKIANSIPVKYEEKNK